MLIVNLYIYMLIFVLLNTVSSNPAYYYLIFLIINYLFTKKSVITFFHPLKGVLDYNPDWYLNILISIFGNKNQIHKKIKHVYQFIIPLVMYTLPLIEVSNFSG